MTVVFVGDPPAVQTGWKVISELLPDGIIELRARLEREHFAPKHQVERQKFLSVVLRRLVRLRRWPQSMAPSLPTETVCLQQTGTVRTYASRTCGN